MANSFIAGPAMLLLLALTTVIVTVVSESALDDNAINSKGKSIDATLRLAFDNWLKTNGKSYSKNGKDYDDDEYAHRLSVFAANAKAVARHNDAHSRGLTSYAMSLDGPFADINDEEFESKYLMDPQTCSATHTSSGRVPRTRLRGPLPRSVDWRTKGVMTSIKVQGKCGSGWIFSATGTLEAHGCLQSSRDCSTWTGLAEQQLLDCTNAYNSNGCSGGLPIQAFEYIHLNGGIVAEDTYNYTAKPGRCDFDPHSVELTVSEIFNLTSQDEGELVTAVAAYGPVSVGFQVAPDFRLYSHGVYDSYNATTKSHNCGGGEKHINHAVVAVGYGETMTSKKMPDTLPFHILRNSWGNTWGMGGYFWMIRGKNMCGVSNCASFPVAGFPSPGSAKELRDKAIFHDTSHA